jgi:hypothetical protein
MKDDQAADPRAMLHQELEQVVSRVASMLAAAAAPAPAPKAPGAGGLRALRESAEARREAVMEHRELAMELVIGALLNEGNTDWDPRNPASCRATYEGKVVQALK